MMVTDTTKLAFLLSYDGTSHRGWTDLRDAVLRPALGRVLGGGTQPLVEAASRTDAGVHARGQVCSVELAGPLEPERMPQLVYSLNQLLPDTLCVREAVRVDTSFDVRSNVGKEYHYAFSTAVCRDPLRRLHEWHLPPRRGAQPWNAQAARDAARLLVGTHSFAAFGNTPRGMERRDEVDPRCSLRMLQLRQLGPTSYQFRLRGDRFLYKMCRNLVGALVKVGSGELQADELLHALEIGRFERSRPLTAPAHGLVLHRVLYEHAPFTSSAAAAASLGSSGSQRRRSLKSARARVAWST